MSDRSSKDPDPVPDADAGTEKDWLDLLRRAAQAYPSEVDGDALRERIERAAPTVVDGGRRGPRIGRDEEPVFPGFRIEREIAPGVGGMGTVYLAQETSLDRVVAVKTVSTALETDAGRAIFIQEAKAAARLDHPNIVRIFSFDPDHSPPFYVMEYVDGQPIDRACEGKRAHEIAALAETIARALGYAHQRGVLHRDIKPDNILVDRNGAPRITDFGLASRWGESPPVVGETSPVAGGTPWYLPPEGWGTAGASTPAVDIYSLGVMVYRLLTGRYPFRGESRAALSAAVQEGKPPLPVDLNPDVPEPLQRICLKAMERDPANRYPRAEDLADDLRRFLEGREVYARPTRYQLELTGRLRNHVSDIREWQEQNLVPVPDMDRLTRPYYRLLDGVSHWREFSFRFPWEAILLRLGGWLVLLSCLLWPIFYWDEMSRAGRIAGVGIPCLLLNAVGWMFLHRRLRLNATIFLSTGALLLPVFLEVVLVELEWLRAPGPETVEWHGSPENAELPTNVQLTVAVAVFLAYCLLLFRRLRATIFAAWIGVGVYLLGVGIWMILGLMERIVDEQFAFPLMSGLALPAGFYVCGRVLARGPSARWAPAFYAFFPIPLVALASWWAAQGAVEWFGASWDWESRPIMHWLMINGLFYGAVGFLHGRSRRSFVRGWSLFFLLVMPLSILLPLNLLFYEGPTLFLLGEVGVTPYKLAALGAAFALVVAGIRFGRDILTVPGLCGLAVCLYRITEDHFAGQESWALGLLIAGAIAMLAGVELQRRRAASPP